MLNEEGHITSSVIVFTIVINARDKKYIFCFKIRLHGLRKMLTSIFVKNYLSSTSQEREYIFLDFRLLQRNISIGIESKLANLKFQYGFTIIYTIIF